MHRYDFFLLMSASRFSENDTWLGNEIARSRRNYFYVRTKIAADISSDRKAHPRTHDELAVIGDIRDNVVAHLKARDSLLYAGAVYIYTYIPLSPEGWWRGTVVERRSLTGELSLSCARPAADG